MPRKAWDDRYQPSTVLPSKNEKEQEVGEEESTVTGKNNKKCRGRKYF